MTSLILKDDSFDFNLSRLLKGVCGLRGIFEQVETFEKSGFHLNTESTLH